MSWVLRKLGGGALTWIAVSVLVYLALEANAADVAVKVLGPYSAPDQRVAWLRDHGYFDPLALRYLRWLGHFLIGDWGLSTHFQSPVIDLVWRRIAASALLAVLAFCVIAVLALGLGVVAGIRAGGVLDRIISFIAVFSTSLPEFASAIFLVSIFVYGLHWLPGVSTLSMGLDAAELVLPVAVLSLSSAGYVARITRASMADVMAAPYIRAARLKGVPEGRIILRHALRNALAAPVTVLLLQIPWLISGVIIVEVFFAYPGFGSLLFQAALGSDIQLIEACAMVSVAAVVATRILSDLCHAILNPVLE